MQCKKVIHLFSAYLDGELMIEEEDRIEQHLNGCPQCHAEFVKLRNMVNLMGQLPQDDPGEAFSQSVMRRIRTAGDAAPLKESLPWGDRLAQWFRFEKAPRPIFGMAATLVLGLVVGAGIYQVLGGHLTGESDSTPGGVIARSEAPTLAVDGDRETPVVGMADAAGAAVIQPSDSLANTAPEFVLDPYIMEDELRQVAVPLYPRGVFNVRDASPKDDTITF